MNNEEFNKSVDDLNKHDLGLLKADGSKMKKEVFRFHVVYIYVLEGDTVERTGTGVMTFEKQAIEFTDMNLIEKDIARMVGEKYKTKITIAFLTNIIPLPVIGTGEFI